jgi:integrase
MLRQLSGRREWDLIEAAVSGPLSAGEIYDYWCQGPTGLATIKARLSDPDLNDLVDGWRRWAQRRANLPTVEKYTKQLRTLIPDAGRFPRPQFTRKRICESLNSLTCSPTTIRRHHAAYSSFANYLVEMEVVEANPLRSIRAPRPNPPKSIYLPLSDVIRLVNAQQAPYSALAALREGAGVEISAAARVRVRDLDPATHTVHVPGTKNSWRDRFALVDDWAWPIVASAAKDKLPDALLFTSHHGGPVPYKAARRSHQEALTSLKLPPAYTMHDARHSFAVRWMKQGVDPQLIANNLGHRDATMVLRIYGKYRPTMKDLQRARKAAE